MLRAWARRRGEKDVTVGLGFYWRTTDWIRLEASVAEEEWARMNRRPKGARLKRAWRSRVNPVTLLECLDDEDQSWYLLGNLTSGLSVNWLIGPTLRCAIREPGDTTTQWAFRFFERFGCRWSPMTKAELDLQLTKFDDPRAGAPAIGWKCPDSTAVLVSLTDPEGRDYLVQSKTKEPESLWYFGFFFSYGKARLRASDL